MLMAGGRNGRLPFLFLQRGTVMERYPLSWQERGRLWMRLGIRAMLTAAVVLLAVFAVPPLFSLFAPFVFALLVAWLLNSPVRWLQRKLSLSRKLLSLVLLVLIFCVIGGAVYGVVRLALYEIRSLLDNWETLVEEFLIMVDSVTSRLNGLDRFLPAGVLTTGEGLAQRLVAWLQELNLADRIADLAGRAPSLVSGLSGFAVAAVVFVMASYFITGDYPRLRFLLTDRVPADTRAFCGTVKNIFMGAFGGYLKSQLLLSLGVFGILTVGFFVVRQPYALLLAAGLAVLDFIPIVGAGTVMVPWALVRLLTGNWQKAAGLLVIWGLTVLFRRVAEPKILGDRTGLSPILSLAGIYGGMKLAGVLGMVAGPVILLVFINLGRLGIFRPTVDDLRMASRDVKGILKAGRRENSA